MRSAEVQRAERAWLTRELTGGRTGLDAAWVALVLLNLVAIAAWPSWDTVPFHLISTGFAVLYGLRLWPADPVLWGLGIVIITTFGGIGLDLLHNNQSVEEAAEIPLLAAMFVAIVWLANRRIGADRERQLIGEKNSRLLEAQRRFLQDASHHLRTPITIALTHAELLARDLDGRELRDMQTVLGEITRLRRLSPRLRPVPYRHQRERDPGDRARARLGARGRRRARRVGARPQRARGGQRVRDLAAGRRAQENRAGKLGHHPADEVPDGEGNSGGQERGGELTQAPGQHRPVGQLRHCGAADQGGDPGQRERQGQHRVPGQERAERDQRADGEGGE